MNNPVSLTAFASISPLGHTPRQIARSYASGEPCFVRDGAWTAPLKPEAEPLLDAVRQSDARYKAVDRSVIMALEVSRRAIADAGWKDGNFGINFGSSRGATSLFEKHHAEFLQTGKSAVLASPTTTLGNISSWVAHDLQSSGPEISHSITCSTGLHAVLNGMAWIRSGMADKFLVGASEAPLTPFTLAQMQAMKIYSTEDGPFACRALDLDKKRNTMILGEAAAALTLEAGHHPDALAVITGVGYATEALKHSTSISANAECFQKSMRMALNGRDPQDIDAIVMHAPGTIAGDMSEFRAIQEVFPALPALTTGKWQTGHTFAASGLLGIEMAIQMLQTGQWLGGPFYKCEPKKLERVMVNSVGFGGNAVSVVLNLKI